MKDKDFLLTAVVVVGGLWLLAQRQAPAAPPNPVAQALGPAVDAVTRLLNGMFGSQTGSAGPLAAPAIGASPVAISNWMASASGFPPAPPVSLYYDAVQGA